AAGWSTVHVTRQAPPLGGAEVVMKKVLGEGEGDSNLRTAVPGWGSRGSTAGRPGAGLPGSGFAPGRAGPGSKSAPAWTAARHLDPWAFPWAARPWAAGSSRHP